MPPIPLLKRLGTRIFGAILVVSVGAILLAVGLLAWRAGSVLRHEIEGRNLQISKLVALRAKLFLDESMNELQAVARIVGPLPASPWASETIFANISLELRRFGWIRVVSSDGTVLADTGSDPEGLALTKSADILRTPSDSPYVSPVQIDTDYTPFLVVGVPTQLPGGTKGAVFAELRLREIWRHLNGISIGREGTAYIITSEGELVGHSDKIVLLTPAARQAIPIPPRDVGPGGTIRTVAVPAQGTFLIAYSSLGYLGWYAAIAQPLGEAYFQVDFLIRQALILTVIVALASGGLSVAFSRRLTMPLLELVAGTQRIAGGELAHRIVARRSDEIGGLASSFNSMAAALQARARDLQTSENKYRMVSEHTTDIIFSLDDLGRFTFVSSHIGELTGRDPTDLIGTPLADILKLAKPDEWSKFLASAPTQATIDSAFAAEIPIGDGVSVPFEIGMTRGEGPDQRPGLAGVARDVSVRKRLEAQLSQAQRMEAVGRLAGGVAHDFNNLLTAILGYCEMAREMAAGNTKLQTSLDQIRKAGDRAASLTQQLLAFSRRQAIRQELLDLNRVVAGMEEMLKRLIGERVTLLIRCSSSPLRVRADRGQLEQIVMNLCLNSRDAMPEGGTITVATGEQGASCVTLDVTDTGVGMSPEVQAHIFEPFYTTKEQGKGTGLGLSMVYGIVKQYNGNITVTSSPGKGATILITFPRCTDIEEVQQQAPAREEARGNETVLVVEDEQVLRELLESVLARAGYHVLVAGNAEAALTTADRLKGGIDLLVSDLVLPGKNGHQLAEELSSRIPGLCALLISGYTADILKDYEKLTESSTFLQKPFTSDALLGRVRMMLDGARKRSGVGDGPRPPAG